MQWGQLNFQKEGVQKPVGHDQKDPAACHHRPITPLKKKEPRAGAHLMTEVSRQIHVGRRIPSNSLDSRTLTVIITNTLHGARKHY